MLEDVLKTEIKNIDTEILKYEKKIKKNEVEVKKYNDEISELKNKEFNLKRKKEFFKILEKNNENIYITLGKFIYKYKRINFGRVKMFIDEFSKYKIFNKHIINMKNLIKIKNTKNLYYNYYDETTHLEVNEMIDITKELRKYGLKVSLENNEGNTKKCYMCNVPIITTGYAIFEILYEKGGGYGSSNHYHTVLVKNNIPPFNIRTIIGKLNIKKAKESVEKIKKETSTLKEMLNHIENNEIYMEKIICPNCNIPSAKEIIQKTKLPSWIEEDMLEIVIK